MAGELASIHFKNVTNRDLHHYPATYGMPLVKGMLHEIHHLAIRTPEGELRPAQARALQRHDDGSIQWLLLDFDFDVAANASGELMVVEHDQAVRDGHAVALETSDDAFVVTTRKLEVRIDRQAFSLFGSYRVNGREMIEPRSDAIVELPDGKRFYASGCETLASRVLVEGPRRVVVETTGRHTAGDGSEMLDFRVRYTFRSHEPGVEVAYLMGNREDPETGVDLASVTLSLPTKLGRRTVQHVRQCAHGANWFPRLVEVRENVELRAGGAVNAAAKNTYGDAADGKIIIRNLGSLGEKLGDYPHFLRPGNARTDMTGGLRQTYPYVAVNGEHGSFVGWFQEMSQNFPKTVRQDRGTVNFDIWPADAGPLRLRKGQSKEHVIYVSFADEARDALTMEGIYLDHEVQGAGAWGLNAPPVELTIHPDYAREAETLDIHRWLPYDEDRYLEVESKMGTLGRGGGRPQLGMLDYGDHVRPDRSWAHNNENDAILDGLRGYYRQQDFGRLRGALAKAKHNATVDFIAYDPDPLRQGSMPAHCPEHTDGSSYPSHMWVGGLLAAYCVSGDEDFRDAALAVGENLLRWQRDNPTIFYCDSRECGWPMLAFLQLHALDHDPRWLDACQVIFEYYRDSMDENYEIQYELPHGMGVFKQGYGEFITWRAVFFYYERTRRDDVKEFLVKALDAVYHLRPSRLSDGGWGCNDLFPAWAGYALTGEDRFIEDNYPFFRLLMTKPSFPWGGVDVMYYLNELHRRGALEDFQKA